MHSRSTILNFHTFSIGGRCEASAPEGEEQGVCPGLQTEETGPDQQPEPGNALQGHGFHNGAGRGGGAGAEGGDVYAVILVKICIGLETFKNIQQ